MPETGSQILSYSGNVGLGVGSNASIPVINPKNNLDIINSTARDILLLNHDNNIRLYGQKIKDRDTTLELLAQGQISSGEIDPNDRPVYDRAKKETKDAFYDMIKNGGVNNPEAVKNYQDKVRDLYDTAIHAQSRQIELKKLEGERANQSLPEDISAYDNHIKSQQQKEFWQPIDPYQKAFDYDINTSTNSVLGQPVLKSLLGGTGEAETGTTQTNTVSNRNGVITKTQTSKSSPLKTRQVKGQVTTGTFVKPDGSLSEISYTPEKYWDFEDIKKNVSEEYATNPTSRYTYQKFLNDVQDKLPTNQGQKLLEAYNNRIADYSVQNGIAPDKTNINGNPHYPDQVNYSADPQTGKLLIQETPSSFFAKHALASINGDYVEKSQAVFNKDIGAYNINKEKANSDAFYKRAMAGAAQTKARAYVDNLRQQMRFKKNAEDQDNFLNEIWQRNLVQQKNLIESDGKGKSILSPIKAQNSLPVFTLQGKNPIQLIPIGATKVLDANKTVHYEGGHYDTEYLLDGKVLPPQQLADMYKKFKRTAGNNWQGGFDDYIKEAVKNNFFDYKLKGANGTTDRELSNAAQRIISNTATKKGQTAVFDNVEQPPLDEQIPDDNQQ